jgi:hypothetical protein
VQDDWKGNRKLTLNLGVRYYFMNPVYDRSTPRVAPIFEPQLFDPAKEALLNAQGLLVPDPSIGHVHDFTTFGNGLVNCGTAGIPVACSYPDRGTIGPRFGFAYDPWGTGKTVVRGGYGIYYELGSTNDTGPAVGLGGPPIALNPTVVNIPNYAAVTPGLNGPPGIITIPLRTAFPAVQQFSLGMQHEIPGNNLLSLSYVGAVSRHLSRMRNIDQVPIGLGTVNVPALAEAPGCDASGNCDVQKALTNGLQPNIFFVPYPGYASIGMLEHSASSNYSSLQVNFRHIFGHGLTFQAAYTWSHALDNATSPYIATVNDYDLNRFYANSDLNRTQMLVLNYIYELPFYKGSSHPALRKTLGGWSVSGITSFLSGTPVLNFACGVSGFASGVGGPVGCNTVGPLKIEKGVTNDPQFGPTPTWFDPSVITQPNQSQLLANNQPGMFGYVARNPLTGPGRNNWDLALVKDFGLPWFKGENSTLQFRWETFNSFNHPQFQYINMFCSGNTQFGQPCNGDQNIGNGEVTSAWPPRIMQFGLKFIF